MKIYTILGTLILLVFTHWYALDSGKEIQKGIEAQARQDIKQSEGEKVKIVYKEKVKIEVKYRDKVKTIYRTADPTGCLDTTLGTVGLLPTTANN